MRCSVQKYFLEAIDGTLPETLRLALDAHLAGCANCREAFAFTRKTVDALRHTPQQVVPQEVWDHIKSQIAQVRKTPHSLEVRWWERLVEIFAEISWGERMAWSSAVAVLLVTLTMWGVWDMGRHPGLKVVDLAANPVTAFPSYFREHHNPSAQPISDGPMVLAFNTLGDSRN